MPKTVSASKLDTINESAQHEIREQYDDFITREKKKGDPAMNKAAHGIGRLVSNQRPGALLGGVGGSIITSSGMNQNFKDYAQGQDAVNKIGGGTHSSSTGMFTKPNFSPGHSPTAQMNGGTMGGMGHRVSGIGTGGGDITGHGQTDDLMINLGGVTLNGQQNGAVNAYNL